MDDLQTRLLAETVRRALGDAVSARGTVDAQGPGIDQRAWRALVDLGLAGEDAAAMSVEEQAAVLEAIGNAAALVPYAESEAMARWLAKEAGIATDDGEILTLALASPTDLSGHRIPWGRHATRVVFCHEEKGQARLSVVAASALRLKKGSNLAGEPSDRCGVGQVAPEASVDVPPALSPVAVRQRGALCRCAAMLGAARRAQELTLRYAADRKQFGKPIGQFQVIQSYLAQMAGELSAASAILATALRAATADGAASLPETAAAKVRIGQAAQGISALAHQVHGAIGFTEEYPLHLSTRRLWAWREEYGNETIWARELGSAMISLGPDAYWERIAR